MVRSNFNDYTSLVPLIGVVASLVLDVDMITCLKWRKVPSTPGHSFLSCNSRFGMSLSTGFSSQSPFLSWEELVWLEWERIPDLPAKDNLCWAEACSCARSVPVDEESFRNFICVEGSSLRCVAPNYSLDMLYS